MKTTPDDFSIYQSKYKDKGRVSVPLGDVSVLRAYPREVNHNETAKERPSQRIRKNLEEMVPFGEWHKRELA